MLPDNASGPLVVPAPRVSLTAVLALTVALCTAPSSAGGDSPTVTTELKGTWVGDFSIPAFDGEVTSCAVLDGSYFVAGDFRWAGEVPVLNIAMWTGSAWTQAGLGLPSPVRDLAVQGTTLLAATDNYLSGPSPVLRFDGRSWHPLGAALYGEVEALLVDGPYVYAAGQLYLLGDTNGYRVVRWDGAEWKAVGGGFDNRVLCLSMFQGALHAGGEFLNAEGTFVSRIARWDGAHWGDVGGGTAAGGDPRVTALAVYAGRLVAGGWFASAGGVETRGIAAWDGSAWQALPNLPQDVLVSDLQTEGPVLHVAGVLQVPNQWAAGLATFNGQTWSPPPVYPDWRIEDVAIGDGALIAVGQHAGLHDLGASWSIPNRDVVVRDPTWHGLTPWTPTMRGLLGPVHTEVAALVNHRGELYAGGYFQHAAEPPYWTETPGIARWDGVNWRPIPDFTGGWIFEMTNWGDRLVIGSPGLSAGGKVSSVLSWDGISWSDLGRGIRGWIGGLAEWQGALTACGHFTIPGEATPAQVAVNRGSGWVRLGELVTQDQAALTDLASFGNALFVAGRVTFPGAGWKGLARWDGAAWVEVPNTPITYAECLLTRQDGLWIGTSSWASPPGGAVWKWDGASWTSIGEMVGSVRDLIEVDGTVVACGSGLYPFDRPTSLAQWDGSQWRAIPGAPYEPVEAMASVGNDLWIGGWFASAGDRQAEGIARWRRDAPAGPPRPLQMAQPWPTPARDQVAFRFTLPADGRVELRIYDVRGALVARPIDEQLPAGTYERTWSFAVSGERVRPGVYFARLVSPAGTAGARVVIGPSATGTVPSRQP